VEYIPSTLPEEGRGVLANIMDLLAAQEEHINLSKVEKCYADKIFF
jgi:hypothetical protein